MDSKLKNNFLVSWIFSEKTDSIILLGVETTINPQNFIKIVDAIFMKIGIFIFLFLMWTIVNLRGRGELKIKGPGYLQRAPDIEFQRYLPIGLDAMFGDCHRDGHFF